ncbi:MAG: hypothetical protein AAB198_00160 [Actinomycetota bacterium]
MINLRLRSLISTSHREDRGAALAIVAMLGSALMLTASVVVARGVAQFGNTAGSGCWEQALATAESALNWGLGELQVDQSFTTGEVLAAGLVGSAAERDWAVAAADAVTVADLIVTPEGEGVFIRPVDSSVIYGVGFCDHRDSPSRRVRVVRGTWGLTSSAASWTANRAFLTDDEFVISGNPDFHGSAASAHANGFVTVSGNPSFHDGCLTGSADGLVSGNLNVHASCPPASEQFVQPVETIPNIVPRDLWPLSEYDMCPDGTVSAGPAHPTLGNTAGAEPCLGQLLHQSSLVYRGWKFDGCCDAKEGAKWAYDANSPYDGAYYFHEATVRVPTGPGTNTMPWKVLIIAAGSGSCPAIVGGDVFMSGNAVFSPYTAGSAHTDNHLAIVSGRDIEWSGNGRLKEPGIVAAHEQIKINGNPQVESAFIAQGACDSPDSNVHDTEISGNPTFTLNAPLSTPWSIASSGPPQVWLLAWDEV